MKTPLSETQTINNYNILERKPHSWFSSGSSGYPGRITIGIRNIFFLWRNQRKTLGVKARTHNKLDPWHWALEIESVPFCCEASVGTLFTAPSQLPFSSFAAILQGNSPTPPGSVPGYGLRPFDFRTEIFTPNNGSWNRVNELTYWFGTAQKNFR